MKIRKLREENEERTGYIGQRYQNQNQSRLTVSQRLKQRQDELSKKYGLSASRYPGPFGKPLSAEEKKLVQRAYNNYPDEKYPYGVVIQQDIDIIEELGATFIAKAIVQGACDPDSYIARTGKLDVQRWADIAGYDQARKKIVEVLNHKNVFDLVAKRIAKDIRKDVLRFGTLYQVEDVVHYALTQDKVLDDVFNIIKKYLELFDRSEYTIEPDEDEFDF